MNDVVREHLSRAPTRIEAAAARRAAAQLVDDGLAARTRDGVAGGAAWALERPAAGLSSGNPALVPSVPTRGRTDPTTTTANFIKRMSRLRTGALQLRQQSIPPALADDLRDSVQAAVEELTLVLEYIEQPSVDGS